VADFIDTNVLLYSISKNPNELKKRNTALAILEGDDCVLSVQVLQEFYFRSTRPRQGAPTSETDAEALVHSWFRHRIVENTSSILLRAIELSRRNKISYWDAAVVAAAESADCVRVLTEDLNHGQKIGAVQIFNLFIAI
jgi:predicted nucleic acid-binding protein